MTAPAPGKIRIRPHLQGAVLLIDLGLLLVALAAVHRRDGVTVRSRRFGSQLLHRDGFVAVRAVEPVVSGLGQQFLRRTRYSGVSLSVVAIRAT